MLISRIIKNKKVIKSIINLNNLKNESTIQQLQLIIHRKVKYM